MKKNGYTIIETMISLSLFLVIIMSGMTALLNANLIHRKAQDMHSIMDSLSFIMENMSRDLRTGYSYQCYRRGVDTTLSQASLGSARSCADGWAVAFESETGDSSTFADQWVYYIDNGKAWKSTSGADSSDFIELTSSEVVLDPVSGFSILGAEKPPSNQQQPLVIIKLVGNITYKDITTPFSLQTSVAQRLIDI